MSSTSFSTLTDPTNETAAGAGAGADQLSWLEVAALSDLVVGEGFRLTLPGRPAVALFRTEDGVHALDDTCSHQAASLADGWVEDGTVECPLHEVCFNLRTGVHSGAPATRGVASHPVRVLDGTVWLGLAAVSTAAAG